ncbi:MAG: OmpA family protein [Bacteroidetes bacterium]|nr:OmpA family protein [Bacteroidota bacterium]
MTKKIFSLLLFSSTVLSVSAQEFASPKKGSLIGFSANTTDFKQPLSASNSFSNDNLNPGFSLMFWKGLTSNLDFSIRYNGLFSSYSKKDTVSTASYENEFEGSLHLRAFSDNHLLNPFLTAGIGAGNYSGTWATYAPLGGGIQINLQSKTYIFLQMNYRASLSKSNLDNNLFYSLGIAENISPAKPKPAPKTVVIPVVAPPKDSDGDGIVDSLDECPTVSGLAQFHGCPDTDGDGIPDKDDKCPNQKGTAKYNGCPIPDTDGDGINDEEDKCPTLAGVAKYNGCPIPDSDGDGVNDEEDRCPNLPGVKENQGCPLVKEEIVKKVMYDAKNIFFATGSSKLLARSYKPLDEVAKILKDDPNLKLDIEGHTDNTGKPDKNQLLSENRAKAVFDYLTTKGSIGQNRLSSAGFGDAKPIASNKTAQGRAKNRRVELKLKY